MKEGIGARWRPPFEHKFAQRLKFIARAIYEYIEFILAYEEWDDKTQGNLYQFCLITLIKKGSYS